MIKKILVPIDGSSHANKALDLATDIAEKYRAKIIILHVLLRDTPIDDVMTLCRELKAAEAIMKNLERTVDTVYAAAASSPYGGTVFIPIPEDTLREIGTLITENARTLLTEKNLKDFSVLIVDANPADCIVKTAEKENVDMIIIGNRGLGRLSGLLMGSVSYKVNHQASCTCVTVK